MIKNKTNKKYFLFVHFYKKLNLFLIPPIIERDSYIIKPFYGICKKTLTMAESK